MFLNFTRNVLGANPRRTYMSWLRFSRDILKALGQVTDCYRKTDILTFSFRVIFQLIFTINQPFDAVTSYLLTSS